MELGVSSKLRDIKDGLSSDVSYLQIKLTLVRMEKDQDTGTDDGNSDIDNGAINDNAIEEFNEDESSIPEQQLSKQHLMQSVLDDIDKMEREINESWSLIDKEYAELMADRH